MMCATDLIFMKKSFRLLLRPPRENRVIFRLPV